MLIKGCNLEGKWIKDILVLDGKISKIADSIDFEGKVIDANGLVLLPGVIDPHVHVRDLNLSYKEDYYTVSLAAAAGGVTTIMDMPNSSPATINITNLELKREAAKKCLVNYGIHFGASVGNIEDIKKAHNIQSVKLYLGSTTGDLLVEDKDYIQELLDTAYIVPVHAEDENIIKANAELHKDKNTPEIHPMIRTNEAAAKSTQTIIDLHEGRSSKLLICHVSTKEEVEILREAKRKRDNVFMEVAPHHLFLTKQALIDKKNFAKMNPPLRSQEDVDALWGAIDDGTADILGTDHAPHTYEEKDRDYKSAAAGVPGIENSLSLMLTKVNNGKVKLSRVIDIMCHNPAKIYGIKNKGCIKEGYDADLVLVDMDKERTIKNEEQFSKCKWSPYDKMTVKGVPVMTIVNGNIIFDNGKIYDSIRGREIEYES